MPPAETRLQSHPGRLIVDALERISVLEIQRRVLHAALRDAGLAEVPSQLEDLTFFVSGPLYERAQRVLGVAFADAMLVEMSPALDHAWERDRAEAELPELATDSSRQPPSSTAVRSRIRSAIHRLEEDGPPSAVDAVRDTDPVHDTDPAPSNKRNTVPYLDATLGSGRAVRVLVVIAHEGRRRDLALALEGAGYAVVTAAEARVAAVLLSRVRPALVVADVETVAPDFEPVAAAFEAMFGDNEHVPVVLLSDHRRPGLPDTVRAIVSAESTPPEIVEVVDSLRGD